MKGKKNHLAIGKSWGEVGNVCKFSIYLPRAPPNRPPVHAILLPTQAAGPSRSACDACLHIEHDGVCLPGCPAGLWLQAGLNVDVTSGGLLGRCRPCYPGCVLGCTGPGNHACIDDGVNRGCRLQIPHHAHACPGLRPDPEFDLRTMQFRSLATFKCGCVPLGAYHSGGVAHVVGLNLIPERFGFDP